ncbi:MAG: uncharacterized membrane-anchored protein YitT (DUF2179 family) [Candidatus Krumholzibacteriia bacterium]
MLGAFFAAKYLKSVRSVAIVAAIISTSIGLALDLIKNGQFESVVNTLMYTSIYIFVSAETLNNLYRKFKITMLATITRQEDAIGSAIASTSEHRTFMTQKVVGGRTGVSYCIVRTIITHEELPQMVTAIQNADPECFYYYHDIEGISSRYYIAPIG